MMWLALSLTYVALVLIADRGSHALLIAAGIAAGLSYLVRYMAVPVLVATIVWVWLANQPGQAVRRSLILLGSFLLIASPQLIMSALEKGHPFYSLHAKNVWFGIYGNDNWGLNWHQVAASLSLQEVFRASPTAFIRNWVVNLVEAARLEYVGFPLYLFSFGGVLAALRREQHQAYVGYLVLACAVYAGTISLAFVNWRLLLFVVPFAVAFAAYALNSFIPTTFTVGEKRIPIRVLAIGALVLSLGTVHVLAYTRNSYDKRRVAMETSAALQRAGMRRAHEVLALGFHFYDFFSDTQERYSIPWFVPTAQPIGSISDLQALMEREHCRFLVYDEGSPELVPGLASWFPPQQWPPSFRLVSQVQGRPLVTIYEYRP